jgi:flagellin-like hook-associated protein FlgL
LSSGLRINSAADDAAGLAIREMMRADIATMNQGIRNTADAISMIQTADGALGVIDEKLTRMKELAEQAATGTYTTAQREIINSEYQAMAAEIDRIANATNFNGIKLLDGSVTNQHGGQGLKIHFGISNNPAEDYYFVNIGDARATSSTGLRIGGDAKNDIWGQGAAGAGPLAGPGCCTTGYSSLDGRAGFTSGETFSYGYNWDWKEDKDSALLTGRYLAGRYTVSSADSLQSLINKVNNGTQSRVGIELQSAALMQQIQCGGTLAICLGEEAYYWGSAGVAGGGTITNSSYTFRYNTSAWQLGNEGYWATGDLRSLLTNGRNLDASATVLGSEASANSAAGEAALQSAISRIMTGMLLTSDSSAANSKATSAYLKSLGVTSANYVYGSAQFRTGIYADGGGIWTTSATLAGKFNLSEVTFNLSALEVVSAANSASAAALFSKANISAIIGFNISATPISNSRSYETDVWVDYATGKWTSSSALASKLSGLTRLTLETSANAIRTSANYDLTSVSDSAIVKAVLSATGFISGVTAPGVYSTGIFVDDNTACWTSSKTIANKLGMRELTITIDDKLMNSAIGSLAVFRGAASAAASAIFTAGYAGVKNTGLFMKGSEFTTSASLATALGGFTELTVTFDGTETAANWMDKVINQNGLTSAYPVNLIKGRGNTVGEVYVKTRTEASNNTLPPGVGFVKQITSIGDSFLGIQGRMREKLKSLGSQYTDINTRDLASLAGGTVNNALVGLDSYLSAVPLTNTNRPAVEPASMTRNENSPVTKVLAGKIDSSKEVFKVGDMSSDSGTFTTKALASAINAYSKDFWAMVQSFDSNGRTVDMLYVFTKEGGNFNDLLACEVAGDDVHSQSALNAVSFENVENAEMHSAGTSFTLGGQHWATMKPTQTKSDLGNEVWNLTLNGRDVGAERDIWIANEGEIETPNLTAGIINGMDRFSFVEIQNAADGDWNGAEVRTQSSAQAALDAITESITKKDKIRADLGALQNRLENTMTNLTVQSENLQASESRISDVDVATEMTEFTRNNVLSQAATSMLAQANSLSQLALSLIR